MDLIVDSPQMKVMRLSLGEWETNAYILVCRQTGKSAIIDAPSGIEAAAEYWQDTTPQYILLTHSHIDHIEGLPALRRICLAPLAMHPADIQESLPVSPDILLNDSDIFQVGRIKVAVIYTPGHTLGSLCFKVESHLFSGDTLFGGGPGHTDRPDEFRRIVKSITEKLFTLPEETKIYPGHGEATILRKEKSEYAIFASCPHPADLNGDIVWLTS